MIALALAVELFVETPGPFRTSALLLAWLSVLGFPRATRAVETLGGHRPRWPL